jgi:predicted TIM-barrel fold metal-dependent hydrolase
MEVFAKAAAAGDKRMKNVYFDLTTVVSENTSQNSLELLTKRMRQIGMGKMVFGSDMHPNPPLRQAWATFRRRIPLTDEEVRTIANNVAPYLR